MAQVSDMMAQGNDNRFDDFFGDDRYVALKNHLYNYRLRKRAIERYLLSRADGRSSLVLEVGSGLSPVMTQRDWVVYTELSPCALATLRRLHGRGMYATADIMRLPFAEGTFAYALCSEVLEHLPDDWGALGEIARVLRPGGRLVLTFPHRRFYFSADDRFVGHYRRYELSDMTERVERAGLRVRSVRKVLGPIEKVTMLFAIGCFSAWSMLRGPSAAARSSIERTGAQAPRHRRRGFLFGVVAPVFALANSVYAAIAWLDARVMPRSLSTVLMIEVQKPASGAAAATVSDREAEESAPVP
ncbi:MAG: class I SAM-dependent methyltransferase [Tepidisphaeraceae bacterium]